MDIIEAVERADFNSIKYHEILGCTSSTDSETLTKAYRDLSRKYHPDRHGGDAEALRRFQRISVAYAALVPQNSLVSGSGSMEMTIPTSAQAAKEVYEQYFGAYTGTYYANGAIIGLPFSMELRDSLEESKRLIEKWTFKIHRIRIQFFRMWIIKWKIDPVLFICETIPFWFVLALCAASWVLGDDALASIFGSSTTVFNILSALPFLLSQFILQFWYGFSRYPSILAGDLFDWWNGKVFDSDLEDIRDVCSYYFHSDRCQRSQKLAFILCLPFTILDHAWVVILSPYLFVTCNKDPRQCLQMIKSISVLLSMMSYYVLWIFFGNLGKSVVAASLLMNRKLYNAILVRKDFGEFVQSILFGESVLFKLEKKPAPPLKTESVTHKQEEEGNSDNEKNSTSHLETSDSDIDIEAEPSIWRKLNECTSDKDNAKTTPTVEKNRERRNSKQQSVRVDSEGKLMASDKKECTNILDSVFIWAYKQHENTQPYLIPDKAKPSLKTDLASEDKRIGDFVIVSKISEDEILSAPSDSSHYSIDEVLNGHQQQGELGKAEEAIIKQKDLDGNKTNQANKSNQESKEGNHHSVPNNPKKSLYKSIMRRIENDFYAKFKRKREKGKNTEAGAAAAATTAVAASSGSANPVGYAVSTSDESDNLQYVTEHKFETDDDDDDEAEPSAIESTDGDSDTSSQSSMTSMGREHEELVMTTSYIVSTNPTKESDDDDTDGGRNKKNNRTLKASKTQDVMRAKSYLCCVQESSSRFGRSKEIQTPPNVRPVFLRSYKERIERRNDIVSVPRDGNNNDERDGDDSSSGIVVHVV